MNGFKLALALNVLALLAIWFEAKELAAGLVIASGIVIFWTKTALYNDLSLIIAEKNDEPEPINPLECIREGMDFAKRGFSFQWETDDHRSLLIGREAENPLGGKSFLPQVRITEDGAEELRYVD